MKAVRSAETWRSAAMVCGLALAYSAVVCRQAELVGRTAAGNSFLGPLIQSTPLPFVVAMSENGAPATMPSTEPAFSAATIAGWVMYTNLIFAPTASEAARYGCR